MNVEHRDAEAFALYCKDGATFEEVARRIPRLRGGIGVSRQWASDIVMSGAYHIRADKTHALWPNAFEYIDGRGTWRNPIPFIVPDKELKRRTRRMKRLNKRRALHAAEMENYLRNVPLLAGEA